MTSSIWQQKSAKNYPEVENVIIGGGIAGVSLAYWLAKEDQHSSTAILEADFLASKASGRNAGFLLAGTAENYAADVKARGEAKARYLWNYSKENLEMLKTNCASKVSSMSFNGTLVGEVDPEAAQELDQSAEMMRQEGFQAAYIDGDQLAEEFGLEAITGGLILKDNGQVNPVELVGFLAKESGATIYQDSLVLDIDFESSKVKLSGKDFSIVCRRVFVAANSYIPKILPSTRQAIRPVRAQMLAVKSPESNAGQIPVYTHRGYFYFRQVGDELIIGGARHLHVEEELGYDDLVTNHVQEDLEKYIRKHIQGAGSTSVLRRWSGTMGFTDDHLPKIGTASDQIKWMGGFSGHGLGFAFKLARDLVNGRNDELFRDCFHWSDGD